ncbi:ATP-binding cassette domain-containing protein [Nonomuraea sp. bgisy101]|uniref:ABC-F family ATP-binding cassette domain-containing protein n=1 Tax=Nonomuraea sp. bgisy101 TaxID=3413784 RepID=UPI003D72DAF6
MQLALSHVSMRYADRVVLDQVSFTVKPGEKVGVIGDNGSGKSTLLKLLAGRATPTNGSITVSAPGGVGYLPQTLELPPTATVQDAVDLALADIRALAAEMRAMEDTLTPSQFDEYAALIARYEARGGYTADARVDVALHGLGLPSLPRSRTLGSLSGGERSRLALAATLASSPELLLLDEPTNDLDDSAVAWLEDHLRAHRGTVVAITHDRVFLDRITSTILEVDLNQVRRYGNGYAGYLAAKAAERAAWALAHEEWKEELARHAGLVEANAGRMAAIPRKMVKAGMGTGQWRARSRTHGAAGRIRQSLQRMEWLRANPVPPPPEPLRFATTPPTTTTAPPTPGSASALGSASGSASAPGTVSDSVSAMGPVPASGSVSATGSASAPGSAPASGSVSATGSAPTTGLASASGSVAATDSASAPGAVPASGSVSATGSAPAAESITVAGAAPTIGSATAASPVAAAGPSVNPSAVNPPAVNPPAVNPPAVNPPTLNPPAVNLAVGEPSISEPLAAEGRVEALAELIDVRVGERLRIPSLRIQPGERLLVTGPNGAGKTTLLRVLAGLVTPDSGSVRRPARIGHLRQEETTANPRFSLLRAYAAGRPGTLDEHADALLALGLFRPADLRTKVGELSVGQRRRVELARLVSDPADLLLLDEPTNHLSPMLVEELEEALAGYAGSVVLVTHDRRLRASHTGTHLALDNGTITAPSSL